MNELFEPIKTVSLKDMFVSKFEKLILSGKIPVGEKLPSERELVNKLNVSRSVVHAGLLELEAKELITIKKNKGAIVKDIKREASLSTLLTLVNYHGLKLKPKTQNDLLDIRLLFETEAASLSARNRTEKQLVQLTNIIIEESALEDDTSPEKISEIDFKFHFTIMEASNNFFYPLLLNSLKKIYLHLVVLFYSDISIREEVFYYHKKLYEAIKIQDDEEAKRIMVELLKHGAEHLKQILNK